MSKAWRRKGGVGTSTPEVLLTELEAGLYSAEPNATFQAVTADTVDWSVRTNGGAWSPLDSQAWPIASYLIEIAPDPGDVLEARAELNTGLVVVSNPVTVT
jgi:hypothetical protein